MDETILPLHSPINSVRSHAAAQQLQQLNFTGYDGGVYHWSGAHNEFCEVCGGPTELFGCQTCNMAYHKDCMTITLKDDEFPIFWFCPHCVDDKFHIPPDSALATSNFPPLSTDLVYSHTTYKSPLSEGGIPFTSPSESSKSGRSYPTPQTPLVPPSQTSTYTQGVGSTQISSNQSNTSETAAEPSTGGTNSNTVSEPEARSFVPLPTPVAKRGRPKRAVTPPKKKSKYSTFSSEVDKALAVIHSELELAAENSRSEDHLHEQIKSLEQQVKLQEGQILLMRREHEKTKRELLVDRVKIICLENAARSPHQVVIELRALVLEQDRQLEEFRARFGGHVEG